MEPQEFATTHSLFQNLRPRETKAIIKRLHTVLIPKGTTIIEQGVWHGQFYIISSGSVQVVLLGNEPGSETIVARLGAGEGFGEMSLILKEPPTATVRAVEDTTLWAFTEEDFAYLLDHSPTLLRNLNQLLAHRLAEANQQRQQDHPC